MKHGKVPASESSLFTSKDYRPTKIHFLGTKLTNDWLENRPKYVNIVSGINYENDQISPQVLDDL